MFIIFLSTNKTLNGTEQTQQHITARTGSLDRVES